jgi:hypothetical protein
MDSHLPALPLSGFFFHNRDVSIGLIGDHFPAPHEAGQDRGFGPALCQEHGTETFIGLGSASICAAHCSSLRDNFQLLLPIFRDCVSGVSQKVGASDNGTNCEVFLQFEHL